MSNESNIFSKPLVWNSVFENVFRNVFAMNRSAYSVLGFEPGLVLDFDAEYYRLGEFQRQFSDAITHTRASTATYVDSNGVLQTAGVNVPRVGHHVWNGSAWVNEGVLHESEARTNLLTYSEDLSNAAWGKAVGVTIGTPVTRKGISLDLIQSDGVTNFDAVYQSFGSVADGSYATLSFFIEAGSSVETAIRIDDVGVGPSSNRCAVPITWASGVPSLQADATLGLTFVDASLQDYGDGLYRVHLTVLNNTGGSLTLYGVYYVVWDEPAAAVNAYAGGFQAEIAPTPSSYIPTSGSTVTRAADVLTIPSANLPWPTPEYIGPELVTNGDFSDGTNDWSVIHGVLSVVDGALRVEEDGVNASAPRGYQAIATEIGKVYRATADLVGLNIAATGSLVASTNTNTGGFPSAFVSSGTAELIFVAQATTTNILLTASSTTTGAYADWDNISVREINPLAVSIQMDGRVTYADEDTFSTVTFVRWLDALTDRIVWRLDTALARTGQAVFQQTEASVDDFVETSQTEYAAGVLVPFNIASRHGSTFINGAVGGTALTANTTPTALPDLSATDLSLCFGYMGTIRTFRIWANDIGDTGIAEATEPSLVPSLSLTFDGTENSFIVEDWSE